MQFEKEEESGNLNFRVSLETCRLINHLVSAIKGGCHLFVPLTHNRLS